MGSDTVYYLITYVSGKCSHFNTEHRRWL